MPDDLAWGVAVAFTAHCVFLATPFKRIPSSATNTRLPWHARTDLHSVDDIAFLCPLDAEEQVSQGSWGGCSLPVRESDANLHNGKPRPEASVRRRHDAGTIVSLQPRPEGPATVSTWPSIPCSGLWCTPQTLPTFSPCFFMHIACLLHRHVRLYVCACLAFASIRSGTFPARK